MKQGLILFITVVMCAYRPADAMVSLWKTYDNYFPIGAAINPDVDLVNAERKKFIASQYNSITCENQMKPKRIHPKEDVYDWYAADMIVDFARKNNMKVRGHTLVWHQATPEWMIKDGSAKATASLVFERMQQHIQKVMGRYSKDVYCWDVVNEAISDHPNETFRPADPLYQACGAAYVEKAFVFARQADPNALLFYNDYRFSNPVKRKKIYDMLKSLKERGVPIDGVGIQSHYVPGEISPEYLQETIDMFSGLGLQIHITELDVSVYNYRQKGGTDVHDDQYTTERAKAQTDTYKMLFNLYRNNKDKITSVTFWGTADATQNFRSNKIGKKDYPFLFDESLHPKKPYYAITTF